MFCAVGSANSGTTQNLNAVTFIDANKGFAVGDSGTILRTTDAGKMWEIQSSETILPLKDIYFVDVINGWIVGGVGGPNVGSANGIILRTTDGGANWYKQLEDTSYSYSCIFFDDLENGWCAGNGTGWKTTNAGTNWHEVVLTLGGPGGYSLVDLYFTNPDTGIVVGEELSEGRGNWPITIITTDGCNSWYQETLPVGIPYAGQLNGVCSSGPSSIFSVGSIVDINNYIFYGIIAKTENWGITWSIEYIEGPSFNDVHFIDETNGWVVGGSYSNSDRQHPESIILSTTSGGGNWNIQFSDTLNVFNSVFFVDVSNGWAVGDGGTILHTTNGGNPVPVELNSFTASANGKEVTLSWLTATELNNQGFEVQRKFGFNDFVTVGSVKGHGTTTSPNQYTFVDKLTDAGKYFYRLKQIDFGGKYEFSQTVEINWSPFTTYKLEQNFSNPFNPTTTIGFGIPEKGNVKLSVLNILGEEIKVLLNEEKEAGYHSIDFNARDLSSGVYFYIIRSGNFIETKKMILLR